MRRRLLLAGSAGWPGAASCRRGPTSRSAQWPLDVRRPVSLPPGPAARCCWCARCARRPDWRRAGCRSLQGDGSIRTDFYEEWSVPPADAVEDVLRQLADGERAVLGRAGAG